MAARQADLAGVRGALAQALRLLRREGIALTDRRAVNAQKLVAAAAVLAAAACGEVDGVGNPRLQLTCRNGGKEMFAHPFDAPRNLEALHTFVGDQRGRIAIADTITGKLVRLLRV